MSLPTTFRPLLKAADTQIALALDGEAFRGLDVFQVDAAEGGFQAGDDLDQLVRVGFVDFDVEDIQAGELLEQHRLAFHDRLGSQRTDVAQAQHRGAVGDHADQVATGGVTSCCWALSTSRLIRTPTS
ncbi:hypothetical protein G6F40_015918 [Rhizopus arrhizus]|nr:hypothetical protein G6F40_015918 [Rhizopus arrhizus]